MAVERIDRRLTFFAGKGGVGRTSLSAAVALAHARRGRRTLLIELGDFEQVPGLFGRSEDSGYEPTRVHDDLELYSCRVDPQKALEEYGLMKLKARAVYRWVFDNDFMRKLLDMLPGLDELLRIGRIWFLEQQRLKDGRPRYERIVVDAPATGHGLSLLRLPQTILEVVDTGPFAQDTRPILEMLRDPRRTSVHLIALPEELPVRETIELAERLREELQLPLGSCFVNKVWPEPFSGNERELFGRARAAVRGEDRALDGLMDRAQAALDRHDRQRGFVAELEQRLAPLEVVVVPYLFTDQICAEELERLSLAMGQEARP